MNTAHTPRKVTGGTSKIFINLSVSDLSGFFRPEKEHEQSETNLIGLNSANSNISYHGN